MVSADLTPLESAVLDKMLAKSGEPFDTIRDQLAHASISSRKFTGVGFFTHFMIPSEAPVRRNLARAEIDGVGAKIPGLQDGAGFLLFIRDGVISFLEGYTYGDASWPDPITEFSVFETQTI
jgi:hypothetical protein